LELDRIGYIIGEDRLVRSKIISSSFLVSILLLSAVSYPGISSPIFSNAFADTFYMEMEGGDYVTLDTGLPDELTELTVSAWVTPDFDSGSKIMTIVSQDQGFVLGINRSLDPQEHATFAVYDGMEWNSITSTIKIKEERTHIAGTFGDGSMSFYVNGELVGTLSNIQTIQINHRGVPEETTFTSISSDSEITVGAYANIKKNQLRVSNEFSGMIHVVDLYDKKFTQSQIQELVLMQFDLQEFSKGLEITPESAQVSIEEESVPVPSGVTPVNEETWDIYKNLHNDLTIEESSENDQVTDETNDEPGIDEFDNAKLLLSNGTTDTTEEGTEETNDEPGIDEFENVELILSNGTTETTEEGTDETNDESGIATFENAELLLSNGTTETTEESAESPSLEEIYANLIRISIKYNELYSEP